MAIHVGGRAADQSYVLAQSAVASSVTGTTTETTLASVTLPGGAMGANGQIEIISLWSYTNSANNKILKVKFGGQQLAAITNTTTATEQLLNRAANRNNSSSQVSFSAFSTGGIGTSTNAINTFAVNSDSDVTIALTGQLANTGETITLESYIIKVFPKA
jgi:hypothetical protein